MSVDVDRENFAQSFMATVIADFTDLINKNKLLCDNLEIFHLSIYDKAKHNAESIDLKNKIEQIVGDFMVHLRKKEEIPLLIIKLQRDLNEVESRIECAANELFLLQLKPLSSDMKETYVGYSSSLLEKMMSESDVAVSCVTKHLSEDDEKIVDEANTQRNIEILNTKFTTLEHAHESIQNKLIALFDIARDVSKLNDQFYRVNLPSIYTRSDSE